MRKETSWWLPKADGLGPSLYNKRGNKILGKKKQTKIVELKKKKKRKKKEGRLWIYLNHSRQNPFLLLLFPPNTQKPSLSLSLAAARPNSNPRFHLWFPLGFLSTHSLSWSHPLFRRRIYQIRNLVLWLPLLLHLLIVSFLFTFSRSVFSVYRSLCFCVIGSRFELRSRFDWYCLDFNLGFLDITAGG